MEMPLETDNTKSDMTNTFFHNSEKVKNILTAVWVIFSFALIFFMVKTGRINYETNDDIIMAQITSGVFGKYSPFNVFNNITLGLIFMELTKIMPGHNWPSVFDLGFVFLSYAMLGVICIRSSKRNLFESLSLPLIFVFSTFKTMILGINFSKVGALAFMTGFLVLLFSLDRDDHKTTEMRIFRIISYILMISGSLFRSDSVKAMLPFILLLIMYFCIKHKNEFSGNFLSRLFGGRLIHILIPFAAVTVLWVINFFVYNTPEWKAYKEYEKLVVDMQDFYGFPAYDAHRDEYETLGLNEHDSVMFSCYIHADNNVFSPDVIKSLDQMAANDFKKDINPAYIKSLIKSVLNLTRYQTGILIVLMLFISGAFIIDKKYIIYGFLSVLLMLAELAYLYHINRVLERSFILPVLGVYLVLIYMIAGSKSQNDNVPATNTVFICILLFAFFTGGMSDIKEINPYTTPDRESLEKLSNELSANGDALYIWDYQSYADASIRYASPIDGFPVNWMGNSLVLGAWPVEMPLMREIASPFGDPGNLMRILAENPRAYYVFENNNPYMTTEAIEEYINDHYDPNVVLTEEKAIGGFTVYSIK